MAQLVIEWRKNPTPTSAAIFLQSLNDLHKSFDEKLFILDNLDDWRVITATWFEMARFIDIIGALSCDSHFTEVGRNKAALICSKIAYCLEEYNKALDYALASGKLFNLTPKEEDFQGHDSLYVNKIIQRALDTYKLMRYEKKNTSKELDDLVDRIFKQNLEVQDYTSVVGLALDTRRIDMVSKAIEAQNANDITTVLTETLNKVWQSQLDIEFRGKVLDLIFNLFENQAEAKDSQKMSMKVNSMCQCLIKLDRPQHVAKIIEHLLTTENVLVAYQLAFDLHENAPQQFLGQLKQELFLNKGDGDQPVSEVKKNLQHILEGEETIKHHMQFLIKNNHTDMLILRQIKDSVRGVCAHNAAVLANGLMHTGTTCDDFLRENLDWISKATNWNKFNAVASLGLIHKGHEREAKKILDPYLPKGDQDQFGYKEGGSLYAYGLIHSNHGNQAVIQYLTEQLTKATTSAVRHGACLALGLAALGTRNQNVYEQLREILYQNEAVSGEAAGTAMGLVMAGSMDENAFNEMRQYILDTQHDKIQRGLRTGIAMLAYGALDKSEQWIAILEENNSESILRQTAVCMLAMAYAGSGKADVISRLLAKVAMDPSNDVKRFGAIAVGFILSGDPELCLMYTDMLVEHFNGHIRYGAAIALAIASAGSGYKESISRLEPLLQAKENYVRQGALIALSFILIQQTASTCPNVVEFRKNIMKMITEKGEDTITKFGAIIAQGILDAGGRNVTLSLHNREGQPDMPAVLGTFVFLQHWYWHSMTHFISLAFRPTCLIGLNKDLKMPKIEFRCNSKPSHFAYPPPLEEKKKENTGKVETAILSIAGKKKGLAAAIAKKKDESTETKMEVDENKSAKEEANQEEKPKEMPEPLFHNISNPARVVRLQLRKLSMIDSAQYAPIKQITQGGIVMFENLKAEDEEEIVELAIAGGVTGEAETKENKVIDPHTPFEFTWANY